MRDIHSRNKYHAKKVRTPDGVFDSQKEYSRFLRLCEMQKKGEIRNLMRQVPYELIPAQYIKGKCVERKCSYIADFVYYDGADLIVEDVKSAITRKKPDYRIKKKLLLFRYGIQIKEV